METIRYYQPEEDETNEAEYNSYSVFLDKEKCKTAFPNSTILSLSNNDIELPVFEDTIQVLVPTLTLTQVLAEYAIMGYDSNDYEENSEDNIHIVAIFTKESFNAVYEEFVYHLTENKDDEETLQEELDSLEQLQENISEYTNKELLSLEFID